MTWPPTDGGSAAARGVLSSLRYCEEVPTNLVNRYLWLGSHRLNGWLAPFSARFIAALARAQIRNGIDGAVAEIGVHHGRLFILMQVIGQNTTLGELCTASYGWSPLSSKKCGEALRRSAS